MSLEIFDTIEQGSDEWKQLRCGIPTASVFADILAKPREPGKGMRANLLFTLAGERLTDEPAESYSNGYMDRGKVLEAEARALYAMLSDDEVRTIGFARNGRRGASPDALVSDKGGLEVKTCTAAIMLQILERGPDNPPLDHMAQIQGNMWVLEREWWDLFYYSNKKLRPATYRIKRDNGKIAEIAGAVARFNEDVDALVKKYGSAP